MHEKITCILLLALLCTLFGFVLVHDEFRDLSDEIKAVRTAHNSLVKFIREQAGADENTQATEFKYPRNVTKTQFKGM